MRPVGASAQRVPSLWPQCHLRPSAISGRARLAPLCRVPSHVNLRAGAQALISSHSALPSPAFVTCWASSEHVIVGKTSSFCGTQTYPCHIDLLLHESWIMKSVLWFLRCSQHFVRLNLFHELNLSEEPNHRSSSKMRDDRQLNLFALSNGDGIRSSNKLTISCYFNNMETLA